MKARCGASCIRMPSDFGAPLLDFPRDSQFASKASRILDLYHRNWQGRVLREDEFVVSADEKTSIQARSRCQATLPTQPGVAMKVEHEYKRCGAWAYLAALDVHRGSFLGAVKPRPALFLLIDSSPRSWNNRLTRGPGEFSGSWTMDRPIADSAVWPDFKPSIRIWRWSIVPSTPVG